MICRDLRVLGREIHWQQEQRLLFKEKIHQDGRKAEGYNGEDLMVLNAHISNVKASAMYEKRYGG